MSERERLREGGGIPRIKERIRKFWQCIEVTIIPVIIGALGTVGWSFRTWMGNIQMEKHYNLIQKTWLLGTVNIRLSESSWIPKVVTCYPGCVATC